MLNQEDVNQQFSQGINCAMQVFGELAPKLGLPADSARRIASAFGGGIGHGGMCGAVCGALMALGLACGYEEAGDLAGRRAFLGRKKEFEEQFLERFGALNCSELLGCDKSTPAGRQKVAEEGLMSRICAPAVCAAVEIVEEMLELE